MQNDIDHLIKHWSAWARDDGNWRQTCCSFERFYLLDKSRYGFPDDIEKQYRFRYDRTIAEKMEKIIRGKNILGKNILLPMEQDVLTKTYVEYPHWFYGKIARAMCIPIKRYEIYLINAKRKIRRAYYASTKRS